MPQRVPFITAGTIDISLGALTRSAERAKLIDYTVRSIAQGPADALVENIDLSWPRRRTIPA